MSFARDLSASLDFMVEQIKDAIFVTYLSMDNPELI